MIDHAKIFAFRLNFGDDDETCLCVPRRLSFILASLSRMLRPWLVLVLMARRRRMMREGGAMLVTLWIFHDVLSAPHHP